MPEKPVLWVIGGTTEGRKLVEYLSRCGADVYVSLATEYGLSLLAKQENIQVRAERLSEEEMAAFLNQYKPDCVIDASHPYAQKVTASLYSACLQTKTDYVRLLRPASEDGDFIFAQNTRQAAEILSGIKGKAFLACGSKEIEAFTVVPDFAERFYVRILPAADSLQKCLALGFRNDHIICMQGPFSQELNAAMLKATGADIMVTKDSGDIGGFSEKVQAAGELGITLIVIGRPPEECQGYSFSQVVEILRKDYQIQSDLDQGPRLEQGPRHYPYFPLFVPLKGKKVKVFGGGAVAGRRITTLLDFGASLEVIAPEISAEIRQKPGIGIQQRPYAENDCLAADLVIAATDNSAVNRAIAQECQQYNIPVSVADNQDLCTFFFPAIVNKDNLVIGLTSSGQDHGSVKRTAQKIRGMLEETSK